jgi:hypothetical protein
MRNQSLAFPPELKDARKIIVILFSLTALGLSSCQGNRLARSPTTRAEPDRLRWRPLR